MGARATGIEPNAALASAATAALAGAGVTKAEVRHGDLMQGATEMADVIVIEGGV